MVQPDPNCVTEALANLQLETPEPSIMAMLAQGGRVDVAIITVIIIMQERCDDGRADKHPKKIAGAEAGKERWQYSSRNQRSRVIRGAVFRQASRVGKFFTLHSHSSLFTDPSIKGRQMHHAACILTGTA